MGQFHLPDVTKLSTLKWMERSPFLWRQRVLRRVLLLLSDKSSVDLGLFFNRYDQAYLSVT